jgi:hypothetical protein
LETKKVQYVLNAFNELALALSDLHHQWTPAQRRSYNRVVRLLVSFGAKDSAA